MQQTVKCLFTKLYSKIDYIFICVLISSLNRDAQGMKKKKKKNEISLPCCDFKNDKHSLAEQNRHRSTHDESRHFLIYL